MPKKAVKRKSASRRGNRVIAYIRVSDTTGREDTLISPEVQMNEIRGYCAREGLIIVDTVTDLNESGRKFDHRKVSSVIDRIEAKEADGVAVWKISRWGRNTMDSLLNIGVLQDVGGFIVSATENLNDMDTPAGKFSLTVLLAIAQMFSDEIGKTWANIHDYRRQQGSTAHGTPRLGYVRDKEADRYDVDPQTSPWVRQAFEWYVAGESIKSIVRRLNEAGVTTTRGNRLTTTSLRVSMDGGFAAGLIVDRSGEDVEYIPGKHEALISPELWDRYLRRRADKRPARTKSAPYRVAGLMRCAACGGGMGVTWRNGKRYFRCNKTQAGSFTTVCPDPTSVNEHLVEAALVGWLSEHGEGEQALQTEIERAQRVERAEVDIAKIDRDIAREEKRLVVLATKVLDEEISADVARLTEADIRTRLAGLRAAREQSQVAADVNSMPAHTVFGAIKAGWDLLDPAILNEGLRKVVDRIEVSRTPGRGKPSTIRIIGGWETDKPLLRAV